MLIESSTNSQHVYHHHDRQQPSFNFKVERNSKSCNWSITIENCLTKEEGEALYSCVRKMVEEVIKSEMAE